ncbi:unnamed protein product [Sphagnum tenellum]
MATLKVRVRAASGGPTMRVQVPWPFTVQALKDVISPLIMRPTSSFCLSLNKKAAIDEGPGTTSLSDLGVINGDLLFYISREGGDSSSSAAPPPQPAADVPDTVVPMHVSNTPTTSVEPTLAAPADQEVKNVDSAVQFSGDDAMEVEIEEKGGLQFPVEIAKHHVSIPDLLQRVLSVEYGNVKERQELLVLAVHAVMLETGFVLSGEVSSSQGSYVLPTGWSGKGGQVNLTYTLPEIKRESKDGGSRTFVGDMVLRSQIVGNVLVVYGVTTSGRGYEVHRVSLPESTPSASQAHNVTEQHATNENGISMFHSVFELWKEVKDKLSLPLLMCLCERAGLPPPASLLIIPTELKVKVLELLPAIALARIGCVCSELKFLAGNNDLWKIRFKEEFGGAVFDRTYLIGFQSWKNAFAREWSHRRRQEQERREADRHMRVPAFGVRIRPRPYVLHFPGVIGGDYDIYPGMGGGVGGGFRPRGWDATL